MRRRPPASRQRCRTSTFWRRPTPSRAWRRSNPIWQSCSLTPATPQSARRCAEAAAKPAREGTDLGKAQHFADLGHFPLTLAHIAGGEFAAHLVQQARVTRARTNEVAVDGLAIDTQAVSDGLQRAAASR